MEEAEEMLEASVALDESAVRNADGGDVGTVDTGLGAVAFRTELGESREGTESSKICGGSSSLDVRGAGDKTGRTANDKWKKKNLGK